MAHILVARELSRWRLVHRLFAPLGIGSPHCVTGVKFTIERYVIPHQFSWLLRPHSPGNLSAAGAGVLGLDLPAGSDFFSLSVASALHPRILDIVSDAHQYCTLRANLNSE